MSMGNKKIIFRFFCFYRLILSPKYIRIVVRLLERCQSGLMCTLGKRVYGNVPEVQILSSPPRATRLNFLCSDEFSFISSRFLPLLISLNCFLLRRLVSLSFEL